MILVAGVCFIQLDKTKSVENASEPDPYLFLLAVIANCLLSGFSGVYWEKMLKRSSESVWVKNAQLSFFSFFFGLITLFMFNGDALVNGGGFFQGYNWLVLVVVLLQSVGGLIVSVALAVTDSISKSFASSASIILTCIASMYLNDFQLSWQFVSGASLVMSSIYAYNKYASKPQTLLPKTV